MGGVGVLFVDLATDAVGLCGSSDSMSNDSLDMSSASRGTGRARKSHGRDVRFFFHPPIVFLLLLLLLVLLLLRFSASSFS